MKAKKYYQVFRRIYFNVFINNYENFWSSDDLIIRFSEKYANLSHPIIFELAEFKLQTYD